MKVRYDEAMQALRELSELAESPFFPADVQAHLGELLGVVLQHQKIYQRVKQRIQERYGKRDENGKLVMESRSFGQQIVQVILSDDQESLEHQMDLLNQQVFNLEDRLLLTEDHLRSFSPTEDYTGYRPTGATRALLGPLFAGPAKHVEDMDSTVEALAEAIGLNAI